MSLCNTYASCPAHFRQTSVTVSDSPFSHLFWFIVSLMDFPMSLVSNSLSFYYMGHILSWRLLLSFQRRKKESSEIVKLLKYKEEEVGKQWWWCSNNGAVASPTTATLACLRPSHFRTRNEAKNWFGGVGWACRSKAQLNCFCAPNSAAPVTRFGATKRCSCDHSGDHSCCCFSCCQHLC